tara:strand:- start:18243 stop:18545 length:303 start_codon:yes stop_codon:yes gene_type:complete
MKWLMNTLFNANGRMHHANHGTNGAIGPNLALNPNLIAKGAITVRQIAPNAPTASVVSKVIGKMLLLVDKRSLRTIFGNITSAIGIVKVTNAFAKVTTAV